MNDITEPFGSGVKLQYISYAAMFLSSTIFYFFLAHILPVNAVGSVSLLYAIMDIGSILFTFGLRAGIQHYFSYHLAKNNNNTLMKLIRITALLGILFPTFAFISIYYSSYYIAVIFFHSITYELSIKIIGIAVADLVVINIYASMLLGLNQYKKYAIVYIFVYTFTYFFPLSLLLIYGHLIYLISGIAIIYTISASIFVFYIYQMYKKISAYTGSYNKQPYKDILHYSFPLFFSSILGTSAIYIDRIIVAYFVNLTYLGIYNYALIISGAAFLLISPVSNLLIPKLSSFFSLGNKIAFKSSIRILLNIVSLLYIPSALGIAALSKPILYVFAGAVYEKAYLSLMIIMFTTSLFIGSTVLIPAISSVRKTRIYILSSSLSLAANLVLSIILIPIFNILGAAIAYSSMNAFTFIIVYYFAKKFEITNYDMTRIFKIWVASLLMFGIVFTLQNYISYGLLDIFICILIGLSVYLIEIKYFKLINMDEMHYGLMIIPERARFIRYVMKHLAYNNKFKSTNVFKFLK